MSFQSRQTSRWRALEEDLGPAVSRGAYILILYLLRVCSARTWVRNQESRHSEMFPSSNKTLGLGSGRIKDLIIICSDGGRSARGSNDKTAKQMSYYSPPYDILLVKLRASFAVIFKANVRLFCSSPINHYASVKCLVWHHLQQNVTHWRDVWTHVLSAL